MIRLNLTLYPKLIFSVRNFIGLISVSLLLLSVRGNLYAQKSETDNLLKQANTLFEDGSYAEAYPMFTQLLSIKKGDPDITFKYGATLLYGSDKKADAIPYLQKSSLKAGIDNRAFYFLGKAYQLNYEFDKAIKNFEKFADLSDSKTQDKYNLALSLQQCNNGKALLTNIKEVIVLDKTDVDANEFFRYYQLENLSGKILIAPEEFQSSIDKKNGHLPIIYSTPLSNVVYFSSYGKKGDQGLDIYYATRKGDGSWSEPNLLPSTINTPFNEDFPFMHPDGKTLYFCSEGHNSMGGFDIFKSVINPFSGAYSAPENLDFAINTPDNDILYIADSLNQNAFFASSRASKQDRMSVYEVKVDLLPSSIILIKGNFLSELDPSLKNARITIEDSQTKRQIGIYNSEASGNYLLDFNYGGAYNFYVEAGKSGIIHTGKVEIPRLESIAAFRQELILIDDDGVERLMIKNYFDEPLEGDIQELLAMALKKRAELDITPADLINEKLKDQELAKQQGEIESLYLSAGFSKLHSNQEVADWADNEIIDLSKKNKDYSALSSKAFAESKAFKLKSDELIEESKKAFANFEASNDLIEKQEFLKLSITLRDEAKINLLNSASAMMISSRLNESIKERTEAINGLSAAKIELEQGLISNEKTLLSSSMNDLAILEANIKQNKLDENEIDFLADVKELEHMKAMQAFDRSEQLRNDKNENITLIKRLETQVQNAKGSDKEAIERELNRARNELAEIEEDSPKNWEKYRELDWNSKVADQGFEFATNWEYKALESKKPLDTQLVESSGQIDKAKENILAMENLDNDALLSLGITYEELLALVPSDKTEIGELTSDDQMLVSNENGIENQLVNEYSKKQSLIAANPDKIEQLEERILLNTELIEEVNRTLEANDSEYSKQELEGVKAEKESETVALLKDYKKEIENNQESVYTVEDFIPEFNDEKQVIETGGGSNLEKNAKMLDFYNHTVDRLGLLLYNLQLMPYPEDDLYLMRQYLEKEKALKILITELNVNQYELSQDITLLSEVANLPTEGEMIDELDENYQSKWNAINNSSADIDVKEAQKIQLNEALISMINIEMADLNREIEVADPDQKILLESKITLLEEIKLDKEVEINAAVLEMAQGNVSPDALVSSNEQKEEELELLSKEDMITSVSPRFNKEITAIEISDMPIEDQLNKKYSLYKELSAALTFKILEVQAVETNDSESKQWISLQQGVNADMNGLLLAMEELSLEKAPEQEISSEKTSESVVEKSKSWDNAMRFELTENAIAIFNESGKISQDPGFQNKNLKKESAQYFTEIQEINSLFDQYHQLELDEKKATDKELKKIQKDKEQLKDQITDKENTFFTQWIPLLHIANEENTSTDNYYQLSKQAFLSANDEKGEAKLNLLKQSYFLSLVSLQSGQTESISSSNTTRIPMSLFNDDDFNYYELSTDEKKLLLEENIESLELSILESEQKSSEMLVKGDQSELSKWQSISKTYQDALVWNQNKLAELDAFEQEIQLKGQQKTASIKAPTGNVELEKALINLGLNEGQTELIINTPELQTYYALQYVENEVQKNIGAYKKMQSAYREQAISSMENYQNIDLSKAKNTKEAESLYSQKNNYFQEALSWYHKTDSLEMLIGSLEENKAKINTNIDAFYANLETENKQIISDINEGRTPVLAVVDEVIIIEQEQEQEQEPVIEQEEIVAEQVQVPEQVGESKGFLFEEGIVFYSKEDPIPVNPPLPDGLIFKVQIGAFRNELPAEHFVGLSPMTAELLDNGITRYSVGIFRDIKDAKVAKNQVNAIGYQDAFIVSFYNGKRIPINEALQMVGQQEAGTISMNNEIDKKPETPVIKAEDFNNLVNTSPPSNTIIDGGVEAPATSVNAIKELFYCVQVGVFSRKVQLSELFGIQPLNLELTGNGYYRYTSGIYSTIDEALKQKEYVMSKGVIDAFITVYYDGDRISLDKANALILENPNIIVSNDKSTKANVVAPNQVVKKETPVVVKADPIKPKKEEVIIESPKVEKTLPDPSELSFVIYIGSYSNSIPNNVATALLENSDIGIKRAINGGKTIYSSKEIDSLTEATVILQRFHERGVDQAKILYVLNGNEISEEEAYEILRK